ncbi:MAG: TIGR03826 family flagellar region protein [Clostridiaceae bacterium]|jgi:flagellar operon protein (TIGR03826 family)|nr:TIGR03826 family flagellar region protein [Clostridiaceae bacterium]
MAEIRNCPRCGKIFTYIGRSICNKCIEVEENEFKVVKEYIYDNPGATISEVSQETEVSVEKIMRFLREERLEIKSENSNLMLECEKCGRPIKSGRFCENCKNQLNKDFRREFGMDKGAASQRPQTKSEKEKMYTATRRKDN